MTRVFSSKGLHKKHLIPYPQLDGYHKDGSPRLPKWKVQTSTGVYAASEYYWWYYYGNHPEGMIPKWLDRSAPLDISKSNLALLSKRELKYLVHFNNDLLFNNKKYMRKAIELTKLALVTLDAKRKGGL